MVKRKIEFLEIDLGMFNEGEVGDNSSSEGSDVGNAPQTTNIPSSGQTVVYGKQDGESTPNAQGETKQSPDADRVAQYAKFKEKYKDLYGADVQGIVKDRFKKNSEIEQQLGQYNPLVSLLKEKYGEADIIKITKKLQSELYESIADQKGWTPEEVAEFYTTKEENKQLKGAFHEQESQRVMDQIHKEWNDQAKELTKSYPDFNFSDWTQNKDFVDLLGAGISVKQAYELCDMENIKAGVAKQMEKNVLNNIQAKGKKIPENGTKPSPGMVVKSSVKDLTPADLKEIERRVASGERIVF